MCSFVLAVLLTAVVRNWEHFLFCEEVWRLHLYARAEINVQVRLAFVWNQPTWLSFLPNFFFFKMSGAHKTLVWSYAQHHSMQLGCSHKIFSRSWGKMQWKKGNQWVLCVFCWFVAIRAQCSTDLFSLQNVSGISSFAKANSVTSHEMPCQLFSIPRARSAMLQPAGSFITLAA